MSSQLQIPAPANAAPRLVAIGLSSSLRHSRYAYTAVRFEDRPSPNETSVTFASSASAAGGDYQIITFRKEDFRTSADPGSSQQCFLALGSGDLWLRSYFDLTAPFISRLDVNWNSQLARREWSDLCFSSDPSNAVDLINAGATIASSEGQKQPSHDGPDIWNTLSAIQSKGIIVADPGSVFWYLSNHLDMVSLLLTICEVSIEKFGDIAQLSLDLYEDPEIDDQHLTLYVRQHVYQDNILELIDEVTEAVSPELEHKSGWLHVTTDFKPPR
jgi:hypothetical protein